jgi:acid phosphatase (class A)
LILKIMNTSRFYALLSALALSATAWAADPQSPRYIDVSGLNPATLLPAPPAQGSPEAKDDIEALLKIQATVTADDIARAKKDEKRDPATFVKVLGPWFTEQNLPITFRVLNKAEKESQSISEKVKKIWQRPRPSLQDDRIHPAINVPASASYPSGHALQGEEWALLLGEMAPDMKDQLLKRGIDFGQSRVIGGVHFPSDVKAGQQLGDKLFAQLMVSETFRADFDLAKKEFDEVRSRQGSASLSK